MLERSERSEERHSKESRKKGGMKEAGCERVANGGLSLKGSVSWVRTQSKASISPGSFPCERDGN